MEGKNEQRTKAFSLQIGRGKRSCQTKRGEEGRGERNLVGALPGSAQLSSAPSKEMQPRAAADRIVSARAV